MFLKGFSPADKLKTFQLKYNLNIPAPHKVDNSVYQLPQTHYAPLTLSTILFFVGCSPADKIKPLTIEAPTTHVNSSWDIQKCAPNTSNTLCFMIIPNYSVCLQYSVLRLGFYDMLLYVTMVSTCLVWTQNLEFPEYFEINLYPELKIKTSHTNDFFSLKLCVPTNSYMTMNTSSFIETPTELENCYLKLQQSAPTVSEMMLFVTNIIPYFVCNHNLLFT